MCNCEFVCLVLQAGDIVQDLLAEERWIERCEHRAHVIQRDVDLGVGIVFVPPVCDLRTCK